MTARELAAVRTSATRGCPYGDEQWSVMLALFRLLLCSRWHLCDFRFGARLLGHAVNRTVIEAGR